MNAKHPRRTWLLSVLLLFVSLPGFPLLMFVCGTAFKVAGLSHIAFLPMLTAHNYYYLLPATVFGPALFSSAEFGLIPTSRGYAVGAIFYAIIAFALSLPLSWLLRRGWHHDSDQEHETHAA